MLKTFAVVVLFSAISDVVWQALIGAVLAAFLEYMRRSTNATIKEEVAVVKEEAVKTATVQEDKLTGIAKATNGYLSILTAKLDTALDDIKSLKLRIADKDVVIADKDKVIGQVIAGAAVLGQGGEGKVGTSADTATAAAEKKIIEQVKATEGEIIEHLDKEGK